VAQGYISVKANIPISGVANACRKVDGRAVVRPSRLVQLGFSKGIARQIRRRATTLCLRDLSFDTVYGIKFL
jgi:hypothetical protein